MVDKVVNTALGDNFFYDMEKFDKIPFLVLFHFFVEITYTWWIKRRIISFAMD